MMASLYSVVQIQPFVKNCLFTSSFTLISEYNEKHNLVLMNGNYINGKVKLIFDLPTTF